MLAGFEVISSNLAEVLFSNLVAKSGLGIERC
jgi:hypothetical protein